MKVKVLAAAAAATLCLNAQAANYDFGTHGTVELSGLVGGGLFVAVGSFSDIYKFTILPGSKVVSSTTVANNLGNGAILNITGGQYGIYDFNTNALLAGSWSFDGTTGNTTNSTVLGAGTYYYKVTGTATASGGQYTLTSSLAPVPEPETYALMLAGLGAIGFVARRRKQG